MRSGLPPRHQSDPVPDSARLALGRLPPCRPPPAPCGRRALPPAGCPGLRGGAALQQPHCLRRDRDSSDIEAPPTPAGDRTNHDGSAPPPPPFQPIAAPAPLGLTSQRRRLSSLAARGAGSLRAPSAAGRGRLPSTPATSARWATLHRASDRAGLRGRGCLSVGLEFIVIARLPAAAVLQKPWVSPQKHISRGEKEQSQSLRKTILPWDLPQCIVEGSMFLISHFVFEKAIWV